MFPYTCIKFELLCCSFRKTSSSSSSSHKSSRHKKHETISSTDSLDKRSKEILEQLNKIAPPVIEDKLWEHVPQEDIVPGNCKWTKIF